MRQYSPSLRIASHERAFLFPSPTHARDHVHTSLSMRIATCTDMLLCSASSCVVPRAMQRKISRTLLSHMSSVFLAWCSACGCAVPCAMQGKRSRRLLHHMPSFRAAWSSASSYAVPGAMQGKISRTRLCHMSSLCAVVWKCVSVQHDMHMRTCVVMRFCASCHDYAQ